MMAGAVLSSSQLKDTLSNEASSWSGSLDARTSLPRIGDAAGGGHHGLSCQLARKPHHSRTRVT